MTLAQQVQARVVMIILSLNQREKTLQCLARLHEIADAQRDILVWDNGSNDGTVEAIRAHTEHVEGAAK